MIHYICNYAHIANYRELKLQPSSLTKINYILSSFEEGTEVTIFSTSGTNSPVFYQRSEEIVLSRWIRLIYPSLLTEKNILYKLVSKLLLLFNLVYYLLFKVCKDDIVLLYHSLFITNLVVLVCRVRSIKYIIELEEIYHASWNSSQRKINKEINSVQKADGYIFVNDFIREKCRISSQNYTICYGEYKLKKEIENSSLNRENKIHLLYAGIIAKNGDVDLAIETMSFLPVSKYKLSILGYGSKEAIKNMLDNINALRAKRPNIDIQYYGTLYGEEFSEFLYDCDIGFCTRRLSDELSYYTYPSKICSYLVHDIVPVCPPLTILTRSALEPCIIFSIDVTPINIAQSIAKSIINKGKNREILNCLDENFTIGLKRVLETLEYENIAN